MVLEILTEGVANFDYRNPEAPVSRDEQIQRWFSVFCSDSENTGHRDFGVFQQNKPFADLVTLSKFD